MGQEYEKEGELKPLLPLTPQQEKAHRIAQTIINAAWKMSQVMSQPIPDLILLKKRLFSDRKTPKRILRLRRQKARAELASRSVRAMLGSSLAASQIAAIQSQPIPKYKQGI